MAALLIIQCLFKDVWKSFTRNEITVIQKNCLLTYKIHCFLEWIGATAAISFSNDQHVEYGATSIDSICWSDCSPEWYPDSDSFSNSDYISQYCCWISIHHCAIWNFELVVCICSNPFFCRSRAELLTICIQNLFLFITFELKMILHGMQNFFWFYITI